MIEVKNTSIIGETFQKIADLVTPTMGAKGRMAIINDEFGRPILTDDGVTVAKECLHMDGFERMIAIAMVEAASNTEKIAYDGTTLTVLMTNELYKLGCEWVNQGMHPQQAADLINELVYKVRTCLKSSAKKPTNEQIKQLATITTKIPMIGDLVAKAHTNAGDAMNVVIEHDREHVEHSIEHTKGMSLDAGYFTKELGQLCNDGDKTTFTNAHLVLLSEGQMTQLDLTNFFRSIPEENLADPLVFFITPAFNPESMKMLLDNLIANKFTFQMVFLNESDPTEVFLDIAAKTGGTIQSSALGTSEYLFHNCGLADSITIEVDKTIIVNNTEYKDAIAARVAAYKKEMKDKKYTLGAIREAQITRRLANLTKGITKIKIATPTITEFMTIKLKLDDAIGAVKCAIDSGIVLGGGKALYNLSFDFPKLTKVLQAPLNTIINNAGIKINKKIRKVLNKNDLIGIDVKDGTLVNLLNVGIIDSYQSIDNALINSSSIASNYLRGYTLIKKV